MFQLRHLQLWYHLFAYIAHFLKFSYTASLNKCQLVFLILLFLFLYSKTNCRDHMRNHILYTGFVFLWFISIYFLYFDPYFSTFKSILKRTIFYLQNLMINLNFWKKSWRRYLSKFGFDHGPQIAHFPKPVSFFPFTFFQNLPVKFEPLIFTIIQYKRIANSLSFPLKSVIYHQFFPILSSKSYFHLLVSISYFPKIRFFEGCLSVFAHNHDAFLS